MIPNSVICDITGVEHLVVSPDQHVSDLIEWSKKKVEEMDSGKNICISIDCEGFNLGAIPHSLHLVQLAQCYDEHIFDPNVETPISLNLKPGFMVLYPTKKEVTDALSAVLSHKNVRLITFDFVGDFCAMMEEGIKLNVMNTLDSKTYGCHGTYFPNRSLKEVCQAGDLCVEYEKCIAAIDKKYSIPFSKLTYECRDDPNPFNRFLTKEFWDYSSHDIALTALAGISCVTKYKIEEAFEYSRKKAQKMLEDQQKYNVLAPSIAINCSFVIPNLKYMLKSYKLHFAYSNYSRSYCIVKAWDLIDPQTKAAFKRDKSFFEESMANAAKYIEEHPDEVKNYSPIRKKPPNAWP